MFCKYQNYNVLFHLYMYIFISNFIIFILILKKNHKKNKADFCAVKKLNVYKKPNLHVLWVCVRTKFKKKMKRKKEMY